jgi:hypothetical protein
MGSFERFKTKTHFNSLKRLVGVTALAALAVKLLVVALATAAGDGTPLDLLVRVPASLADLGAALLVFEILRTRRPLQLAARSAILVAVSPVLFVASGIHGDRLGVAVALLLLAMYLLVDRDAPLVAGITLAVASRVEPTVLLAAPVAMAAVTARTASGAAGGPAARSRLVHFAGALAGALFAAWVPTLAWNWDSLAAAPSGTPGPGGLGPGWVLARSLEEGLAGWLLGPGRPLVLAAAVLPAVVWVRRRPRRAYAAVGLVLLTPLALSPAWSPRDLVWPAVFGYLGDARWASIYAVAAGATLLWTATWWGSGVPWDGGVDPATVPAGSVAGLSLVTWVVLSSWLFLGWRTITIESGAAADPGAGPGLGTATDPGAVDSPAHPPPLVGYAPPPGDPAAAGRGAARPRDDREEGASSARVEEGASSTRVEEGASSTREREGASSSAVGEAAGPAGVGEGTGVSRPSVGVPK